MTHLRSDVVEQIGRWWNGRWGLARRDLWLVRAGDRYGVMTREGRDDHRHLTWAPDALDAERWVLELMADAGAGEPAWIDWSDL